MSAAGGEQILKLVWNRSDRVPCSQEGISLVRYLNSRVRGLRGIWVSGGEAEGLHFVGVLSFGDEFREDGAFGGIQEKFGEALA